MQTMREEQAISYTDLYKERLWGIDNFTGTHNRREIAAFGMAAKKI
jgi:hypothetical protein